jgi:acetate---CoA ligase (ADP-forming)
VCNPNEPDTDDMSETNGIPNLSDLDELPRLELDRSNRDLTDLLSPKAGIAFVGSVDVSASRRLQMSRYGDVKVCFVNPRGGSAEEFSVFKSMLEVPDEIELAVINVNASRVAKVIEECGQRGVKFAVVFSDGFSEVGSVGAALERELRDVARRVGVRIIGPNTNDNSFEHYPVPKNHRGRRIAMITQSGANGRSVVEGVAMGASFWRWVTAGNEVDLELSDYLHHFVHTEEVGVVALYVEGFRSAPKIRVALEEALLNDKPVVAIKMGSTESGARSAATHTGHLVGSDAVVQGLFRQYGVTRVDDLDELLETANLFSKLPAGTGPRCAMYSVSGGTSALMAENAARFGIPMPVYPDALQKALHKHIQPNLSVANPIDNGGALVGRAPQEVRLEVLDVIASNPDVDIIVIGLNAAYGPLTNPVCADILAWAPTAPKPVVAVWTSVMVDTPGYADLVASGVPIFRSVKKCMRALSGYSSYQEVRRTATPRSLWAGPLTARQAVALEQAGVLRSADATDLLTEAGIPLAREALVQTAREGGAAAERIGFPVAVKVMSPDFPHKTDLGLVHLGATSRTEVEEAAAALLDRARSLDPVARLDGILVQEEIHGGVEMLVGLSQDAQFGPVLTVGAGGIYAEMVKDFAVSPLPVTEDDVRRMIGSLRIAPLLAGGRSTPSGDVEALVALAMKVADLALASQGRVVELDLNPVLVQADRAIALDALVAAAPEHAPATRPF